MISIETSAFIKSIEEAKKVIRRKLENMLRGFSYQVVTYAINNTPIGDAATYAKLYEIRKIRTGLEDVEGFAKGSWQVSLDGSINVQENYGRDSATQALGQAKTSMSAYRLGQTVLIGNKGPYILDLENNYSAQTDGKGIIKPTIDQIMSTYAVDLKNFYDKG